MPTQIVFPAPRQVSLVEVEVPDPGPGEVRVRTRYSLMSTGTENIAFSQAFSPGTHWDHWVRYPFAPGYACVGEVDAVGPGAMGVSAGDLVFVGRPHASHHVVAAERCVPIGEGVDLRSAPWCALAAIAYVAARNARYEFGESVLVLGAGPIGQMSVRWARTAGLRHIVVVDPLADRLPVATQGGATAVIAAHSDSCLDQVRAATGGSLPSVVIDATGHADVFADALRLAAFRGRVVLVGDTGTPERQHLTMDVLTRGLTIVGTHAMHLAHVLGLVSGDTFGDPASIAAVGRASSRFGALFFDLVRTGRFPLEQLVSHTFAPADCAEAYALANHRRGDTTGIVFDWSAESG